MFVDGDQVVFVDVVGFDFFGGDVGGYQFGQVGWWQVLVVVVFDQNLVVFVVYQDV